MKKQQVIFMCGPDRCGKTEIGKALSSVLDIPYFKASNERVSYLLSRGLSQAQKIPVVAAGPSLEVVEKEIQRKQQWNDQKMVIRTDDHESELVHESKARSDLFLSHLLYADPRVLDVFRQAKFSMIFDRGFPCEWVYSKIFNRESDQVILRDLEKGWAELGARIIICSRSSYRNVVDDIDPELKASKLQKIDELYREFAQTKNNVHILNVDDENLEREVNEALEFMGYSETERVKLLKKL